MNIGADTPRVWIACLASYNAGRLIGEWVDVTDVESMNEAVERIKVAAVKAARADGESDVYFPTPEEFAIHDYENFGSVYSSLGEYPDWKRVVEIGRLIEEKGDQFLAWLEFIDNINDVDIDDMESRCDEQCCGNADSEDEFSEQLATELGLGGIRAHWENPDSRKHPKEHINIIEELSGYIDWEKVAQEDFDHGSYVLVKVGDTGYVFDSEK